MSSVQFLTSPSTWAFLVLIPAGCAGSAAVQTLEPELPIRSRIVFESDRSGTWDIYSINPDGSDLRNLTQTTSDERYPSCSYSGLRIVFSSTRDGNPEIFVMNSDGIGKLNLTQDWVLDESPSWSPDEAFSAFRSARDGNGEIYTMEANALNKQRVTDHPANDLRPSWCLSSGG